MFVPLTPEEQQHTKPPCRSRDHDPPNMMLITHPMKWVCPACGAAVILRPSEVYVNCGMYENTAKPGTLFVSKGDIQFARTGTVVVEIS